MTEWIDMNQRQKTGHWAAGALLCAMLSMGQSSVPDALEQARVLYNSGQFAEAIRLAEDARRSPAWRQSATIVIARAHLEMYRAAWDREDLTAARAALRGVIAVDLEPRERIELLVAFGELLYLDDEYTLDDRFSAAAEQFEVALVHADVLDPHSRDVLFDWWAGALDRQAQRGPETDRGVLYQRIVDRARQELAENETGMAAAYWLAAGASGARDTTRAVGAAVAAWARAGSMGERGAVLRLDLERLMLQVILPSRALDLARGADPGPALRQLELQWDQFRQRWAGPSPAVSVSP
jgi:tetratricopeptide (TPR) repeat protein